MENNKVMTMKFVGMDDFSAEVYRCLETGVIYKNIEPEEVTPTLHACGNDIDGDPGYPINTDNVEIRFLEREPQPTREEKFNYQLLSRLEQDCKYYLGYGNRYAGHLWAKDEKRQIEKMKELYNSFEDSKKPQWLTLEQILEYERLMISVKKIDSDEIYNLIAPNRENLISIAKAVRTDFAGVLGYYQVFEKMPVEKALRRVSEDIADAFRGKEDLWIEIRKGLNQ